MHDYTVHIMNVYFISFIQTIFSISLPALMPFCLRVHHANNNHYISMNHGVKTLTDTQEQEKMESEEGKVHKRLLHRR